MACCNKILGAAERLTGCECQPTEFPFVCPRHGNCEKHEHYYHLCRSRLDYFNYWERKGIDGPCLNSFPPEPRLGLGDAVAWLLSLIGIKPWPGCGCQGRKAWLNRVKLWRRRAR